MFYKKVINEALNCVRVLESIPEWNPDNLKDYQSSLISQLIYNIFGGEILKTHKKNSWHFYNRINGERIDFTISEINELSENIYYEDLPCNPNETQKYFEQEDYLNFYTKFVRAFEEIVEQEKYQSVFAT